MQRLIEDQDAGGILNRSRNREITLMEATASLQGSFITDGDSEADAKTKVTALSTEIGGGPLTLFIYGNTQPLIDAVNNSTLTHMTAAKKQLVIDVLSNVITSP